jgi:hypothetical protein
VSSWTSAAEGTYCGTGKVCHTGACQNGCYISGSYYSPGDANPAMTCQSCQPSMALTSWSTAPDGTGCAAGQVCSAGTCKSGCYVAGTFYNPGNYGCQQCQPATSTSSLVASPEGTSCSFTNVCHSGGCTKGCYIGGAFYSPNALNPSEPCQQCVPASPTTTASWTAVADGTGCATGKVCKLAACTAGCYILGAYKAPNAVSGGDCQSCQPSTSTTVWSNLSDGTSCGASMCGGGACDATTWSHTYLDYGPVLERAAAVRQTSDGGYLVLVDASYTVDTSLGVARYFNQGPVLLKLNASGAILWGRRFAPPNAGTSTAGVLTGVAVRELGGAYYVLLRESILVELDTTGTVQWAKNYPGLIFNSLDVTMGGQLLLSGNNAPSAVIATYVVANPDGVPQHAGYVNGTVGFGAIADHSGTVIVFGNQQDPNGSIPWAGRVDPIANVILSQLRFSYGGTNTSDGPIVGAVEQSPGKYVFTGVQTLYGPGFGNGTDHPFIWASGTDLSTAIWSAELASTFDPVALTAIAGGGVAIVGGQVMSGIPGAAFLLELDAAGALTQANAYSNAPTPSFVSISTTSTPGFAIGGSLGGPLAMSTKADGTVAGTCDQGLGSSLSVTLQPFALLTTTGTLKAKATVVTPTTATLTTVATDGFTLTAQCHP